MRRALIFTFILISTSVFAQTYSSGRKMSNAKAKNRFSNSEISLDVNFGITNLFDKDLIYSLLKDNNMFGVDIGATKTFDNQFYVSSGFTIGIIDDGLFGLWTNDLSYFSINADVGYRFKSDPTIEPYVAVGGSFISTTLDEVPPFSSISRDNNTFSLNLVTGSVFWIGKSNYGVVVQHTLKVLNDDYMVSHNRMVVGIKYRFKN